MFTHTRLPCCTLLLHIYHRQYCRCAVIGRSGSATQSLRFSRFFLISSEMRTRVFSSLSKNVNAVTNSQQIYTTHDTGNVLDVLCISMFTFPRALNSGLL